MKMFRGFMVSDDFKVPDVVVKSEMVCRNCDSFREALTETGRDFYEWNKRMWPNNPEVWDIAVQNDLYWKFMCLVDGEVGSPGDWKCLGVERRCPFFLEHFMAKE